MSTFFLAKDVIGRLLWTLTCPSWLPVVQTLELLLRSCACLRKREPNTLGDRGFTHVGFDKTPEAQMRDQKNSWILISEHILMCCQVS